MRSIVIRYDLSKSTLAGALLLALASTSAHADEKATFALCGNNHGTDTVTTAQCQAYISGFLAGALLTDKTIVGHVAARDTTYSSFTERAFRTRVGASRVKLPPTYMADFCLPADRDLNSVATEIASRLAVTDGEQTTVAEALYDQIRTDYPCDTTRDEG